MFSISLSLNYCKVILLLSSQSSNVCQGYLKNKKKVVYICERAHVSRRISSLSHTGFRSTRKCFINAKRSLTGLNTPLFGNYWTFFLKVRMRLNKRFLLLNIGPASNWFYWVVFYNPFANHAN